MTAEMERILTSTFRKMFRKSWGRHVDASKLQWRDRDGDFMTLVDWIVRATAAAEKEVEETGLESCTVAEKRRKQRLLEKTRYRSDGRGSVQILD